MAGCRCAEVIAAEIRMLNWVKDVFCKAELTPSARSHINRKLKVLKAELYQEEDALEIAKKELGYG